MKERDRLTVEFSIRAIDKVLKFNGDIEDVVKDAIIFVNDKMEYSVTSASINERLPYITSCVEIFTLKEAKVSGLPTSKIILMVEDIVEKADYLAMLITVHRRTL